MRVILFLSMIVVSIEAYPQTYQWAKKIGTSDYESVGAITTDNAGNIYTAGSFKGTVDFDPGSGISNKAAVGGSDAFILKLDADGNMIWVKTFGSINDEGAGPIEVDAFGNVYVGGRFVGGIDFDPGPNEYRLTGDHDAYISKLDASGNFLWARTVGGQYSDSARDIDTDAMGNVYITGYFEGAGDFDPGDDEFNLYTPGGYGMFVMKLDDDGNFLWAHSLNGSVNTLVGSGSIAVDDNGNSYIIGGFTEWVDFDPGDGTHQLQSKGGFDIFILKLNADGEFIWAKQMGGTGNNHGSHITFDKDGNLCLAGTFEGTSDFDPGPAETNLSAIGKNDVYMSKMDSDGNFSWARSVGGSENESVSSIATDPLGNILISGLFKGKGDFDPGPSQLILEAKGTSDPDVYLLELNTAGGFVSGLGLGGIGTESLNVTIDADGAIYAGGFISANIDFGAGIGEIQAIGTYDIIILKMNAIITGSERPMATINIEMFPNPSSDFIKIGTEDLPTFAKQTHFVIEDEFGREMFRGSLQGGDKIIDIRDLDAGLYFLRIDNLTRLWRFVKL